MEFSGDTVGEYLGVSFEDETAATHRFLAKLPGYQGWQWAAVVAAHPVPTTPPSAGGAGPGADGAAGSELGAVGEPGPRR